MKCEKCGADISANTKFCPECGQKVTLYQNKTLQLKCKFCGGTMTVDRERTMLSCPFCGSKELIQESDEVVIQRIQSQTYKEVELEKIKFEATKERRKAEQEQKKAADKEYKNFKKGKFSKVLIVVFLICILAMFVSFSNGHILSGLVASVQAGLFAISWLMGMKFIKEKIPKLHILLATISFLLIIVFLATNSFKVVNNRVTIPTITTDITTNEKEGIYTYQIRDYVGKNLATIGRVKYDDYGQGHINLIFVTENGMLINPEDNEQKQEYVVSAQSIKPGTNITFVHSRDSQGEPERYLVNYQSYEEIVLYVHKLKEDKFEPSNIVELKPILDRHKYYVRNYVGRNAASFGRTATDVFDDYGSGHLKIVFMSESGEYIDVSDKNVLKQYIVVGQNLNVNTELVFEFEKDRDGIESDYLIKSQNYEEITLTVKQLNDSLIEQMPVLE